MKHSLVRLIALPLLALAMLVTPAAAQDGTTELLEQLPGLESAWAKRYDDPSLHAHDEDSTPVPLTANRVTATILEFDTEANATLSFSLGLNEETAALIQGTTPDSIVRTEEIELGDSASLFVFQHEESFSTMLAIRDGNLGYLISAWGDSDSIVGNVRACGEHMVATEPGSGDIVFQEFAESTGGVFDIFPTQDDSDVLQGLVPAYEYNLLISNSPIELPATPAA